MKKNSIRKLTIAGVLVAVAVVGSLFSIPVLGAKCSPVQHMVNVLGAVLLGPWYALGMGFADTIDGFENRTLDECRKLGVNDSMIHEDFMIGTADLCIDATCEDGKTVPIFRNGTWAF